jgi:mannitol-1-/sugar-/sorbitol-6-phosphatase
VPPLHVAAILFDLDGTLVDSTLVVERLWREWSARHGIDPDALLAVSHGRPAIDTMRQFRPDLLNLDQMAAEHINAEEQDTTPIPAIPGAAELLASLPPDRWAIVTSCPPVLARVRREAASLPAPKTLVTAHDIERGKPAPDCFLLAAKQLGVEPEQCLVVEDSPAGARAGKAAGMKVLAVTTTHRADEVPADWHRPNLLGVQARAVDGGLEVTLP